MRSTWKARRYKPGDEAQIIELYDVVFNNRISIELWNWLFKNNPAGHAIIWLAKSNKAIVGQYAIMPVKMKVGNRLLMGAQSLGTMTHPSYRRQGIFTTLANKVYDEAKDIGISLLYGFPGERAYYGFVKKLNWFGVCRLEIMSKPLTFRGLFPTFLTGRFSLNSLFSRKPKEFDEFSIEKISSFDENINRFWEEIARDKNIAVEKNKEYLNWRYVERPDKKYVLFHGKKGDKSIGYVVLSVFKRARFKEGCIVDVMSRTSVSDMEYLVSEAIDYFKQHHVDVVSCWASTGTLLCRILKKYGFGSTEYRDPLIARINSPEIDGSLLKDPENWFITMGDSDHY